jgi:hypothetical protein
LIRISWKPYLKGVRYCSQLIQAGIEVSFANIPLRIIIGIRTIFVRAATFADYLKRFEQKKPIAQPEAVKTSTIKAELRQSY